MIPALTPHDAALHDKAVRFAEETLAPNAVAWEENEEFPRAAFRALCALGFGAMVLPTERGGAGLSNIGAIAVFEALARGDFSTSFAILCQNSCTRSLWQHGSEAQKDRWLPALTSGAAVGSYVITEPEAGSDPASMSATGREHDGGWTLDGEKWLLSNAPEADLFLISVKTDAEAGPRGISSFLVPRDTEGLEVGPRSRTVGARALPVGTLKMTGCRVGSDALLGEAGAGFKIALDAVNFARIVWGGLAAGLAQAALDEAIAYARERQQFGRPIADFQGVQFQLADLATEIEATRLLAYRAAALVDAGERYIEAAAMTKRFGGDMVVRVTSHALELLGGRGFLAPNPLERYMRQARMAQLADGTANIQRLVIARSLLKG